jgi:hypothetical protein
MATTDIPADAVPQTLIDHIMRRIEAAQANATGVTHAPTWQNCHCNLDDCAHCVKRAQVGTEMVLAAHERLYPGLREAAELAQLAAPAQMARALKRQESVLADMVAMIASLTASQQQLASVVATQAPALTIGPRSVEPPPLDVPDPSNPAASTK